MNPEEYKENPDRKDAPSAAGPDGSPTEPDVSGRPTDAAENAADASAVKDNSVAADKKDTAADNSETDVATEETAGGGEHGGRRHRAKRPSGSFWAFTKKRNFRYGSVATALTALVIVAVVIVNWALTAVVNKFPLSLDLTANKDYNLSSETAAYLKKIKTPINIYVMDTLSTFQNDSQLKYVYLILKQYPQRSSKIKVNYVNLNANPAIKAQYPTETLSAGDIIVANGSRYKHLTSSDYFETSTDSQTYSTTITGNESEQALTSALLYVTNTNLPKALVTTGHKETEYTGIQSLLTKNNYDVTVGSVGNSIDSKYSMVIIADPGADFTSNEITALNNYLTNNGKYGKSLMVFFSPEESALPNLENYVANYWGIQADKGIVYDNTHNQQYAYYPLGTGFDSTVMTKVSTDLPTVMPAVRPLTLLYSTRNDNTTSSLVSSYDSARVWVPKNSKDTTFNPTDSDKKGPFTTMAMSSKSVSGGETLLYSRVIVSGSAAMMDDSILTASSFANQQVLLAAASYLGGYTPAVNITTKSFDTSSLTISTPQILLLGLIFLLLVPIALIVAGIVVWIKRRHL